jgi:hypothetical protein
LHYGEIAEILNEREKGELDEEEDALTEESGC